MAQLESVAGVDSYVLIGKQTAFGSEQATCDQHIGLITSFKPTVSNSATYTRGFKGTTTGGRNVAKIIPGTVTHRVSIEMNVINWNFMEYVLGGKSGSGTVTYAETDQPPFFTMHRCIVNPGSASTNRDEIWIDCFIESVTIKSAVGEVVTVSLDIMATQRKYDSTVVSAVALPTVEVYNFVYSTISVGGSSVDHIIDSEEVTITNGAKTAPGLGSRFVRTIRAAERDYKLKHTVKYKDEFFVSKVLGSATPTGTTQPTSNTNIVLVFGNNNAKTMTITFTTVVYDDLNNNEEVGSIIGEDLSATAISCGAVEVQ